MPSVSTDILSYYIMNRSLQRFHTVVMLQNIGKALINIILYFFFRLEEKIMLFQFLFELALLPSTLSWVSWRFRFFFARWLNRKLYCQEPCAFKTISCLTYETHRNWTLSMGSYQFTKPTKYFSHDYKSNRIYQTASKHFLFGTFINGSHFLRCLNFITFKCLT